MRKKVICLFVFSLLAIGIFSSIKIAKAEDNLIRHYKVDLIKQEDGSVAVNNYNIVVSLGSAQISDEEQDYLAELYSLTGEKLLESYFSMPEEGSFLLKIPYKENGKEIKILSSDNGEELLKINVQVFAKVCGDKECQGHESYENCADDCPSGGADDYCDHVQDEICDPDCQNVKDADPDCSGENPATAQAELKERLGLGDNGKKTEAESVMGFKDINKIKKFIAFIGLIAVAVLVIAFLFLRGKNKKDLN